MRPLNTASSPGVTIPTWSSRCSASVIWRARCRWVKTCSEALGHLEACVRLSTKSPLSLMTSPDSPEIALFLRSIPLYLRFFPPLHDPLPCPPLYSSLPPFLPPFTTLVTAQERCFDEWPLVLAYLPPHGPRSQDHSGGGDACPAGAKARRIKQGRCLDHPIGGSHRH